MSIVRCASRWLAVVLVASFAACGGGGGGGGSTPPAPVGSKIFVGDANNGAIGSSPNSNPSAGAAVVDRIIQGGNTLLSSGGVTMKDFAIDAANDRLYVADGIRILAFDGASTATGNVTPRVVATATGGPNNQFAGIYLDTVNNRLYATVRSNPGNEVRVYNSASTATNATAARTFSFTCDFMFDIAVDTTLDVAYVYYQTSFVAHVAVFDNQSARSTLTETPSRTIDFLGAPASTTAVGMFLDTANDRLYVPNVTGGVNGTVEVYNGAHLASGTGTQSRTITLVGVTTYAMSLSKRRGIVYMRRIPPA